MGNDLQAQAFGTSTPVVPLYVLELTGAVRCTTEQVHWTSSVRAQPRVGFIYLFYLLLLFYPYYTCFTFAHLVLLQLLE
jgi:hypothetical protein